MHRLPQELLGRRIDVCVIGCGGTGCQVAAGLPYLHQAMRALGHPEGLRVTLIDGDRVSPTNCVRQAFSQSDVGHYKSVILANRINLFFGLDWMADPRLLERGELLHADIVIGCVDTREARFRIERATSFGSGVRYWLDIGNKAEDGQFVLGEPANMQNDRNRPGRLPTVAELYPESIDFNQDDGDGPSCSAVEALTRQGPFVNQVMASHALALLGRLFRFGLAHHGGFVNLETGRVVPIPVPAAPAAPGQGKGARARRRARRQPA